uniref:Uncharacterized protein n=1 Tax=Klebsiella pneumoniae TaxID=573 RepID=A0A8B0SV24_KLEPN|nr:hypothetical protein [Klebsiella pneumoniae]
MREQNNLTTSNDCEIDDRQNIKFFSSDELHAYTSRLNNLEVKLNFQKLPPLPFYQTGHWFSSGLLKTDNNLT